MELREATTDDLDALVERWYALARSMEAYDELNELAYADADEVPADGFQSLLDDPDVTVSLVVHEDDPIGYVTLREGRHPSREYSRYLRIVDLFVDEDHRGDGHGTRVVERVADLARERGCDHLTVACEWENEDARRFYRDAGFRSKQVEYAMPLE